MKKSFTFHVYVLADPVCTTTQSYSKSDPLILTMFKVIYFKHHRDFCSIYAKKGFIFQLLKSIWGG